MHTPKTLNLPTTCRAATRLLTLPAAAAFAALLAFGGSVPAQPQPAAPAIVTPAGMTFQQIVDQLSAQGYRDVREIERKSDKLYEVKARDTRGQRVELVIDARSGEVLRSKLDD